MRFKQLTNFPVDAVQALTQGTGIITVGDLFPDADHPADRFNRMHQG